jgi:nucleoside 2-deoxyribosyltransferase
LQLFSPGARVEKQLEVYLAGPDVFLPDAPLVAEKKKALCLAYGFLGLFPADIDPSTTPGALFGEIVYERNAEMMRSADLGIFNLTPFRGPSADSGTIFELGVMSALGKPCFGYTNDIRDFLTRVKAFYAAQRQDSALTYDAPKWRDDEGMVVEHFNTSGGALNLDNLMIERCLEEQGRPIIRVDAPPQMRFRDLRGFEECLKQARDLNLRGELSKSAAQAAVPHFNSSVA